MIVIEARLGAVESFVKDRESGVAEFPAESLRSAWTVRGPSETEEKSRFTLQAPETQVVLVDRVPEIETVRPFSEQVPETLNAVRFEAFT